MRYGSPLQRSVLTIAQPRTQTLNMGLIVQNMEAAVGPSTTWSIETGMVARATRGHFDDIADNTTDIDLRATGGLLS